MACQKNVIALIYSVLWIFRGAHQELFRIFCIHNGAVHELKNWVRSDTQLTNLFAGNWKHVAMRINGDAVKVVLDINKRLNGSNRDWECTCVEWLIYEIKIRSRVSFSSVEKRFKVVSDELAIFIGPVDNVWVLVLLVIGEKSQSFKHMRGLDAKSAMLNPW